MRQSPGRHEKLMLQGQIQTGSPTLPSPLCHWLQLVVASRTAAGIWAVAMWNEATLGAREHRLGKGVHRGSVLSSLIAQIREGGALLLPPDTVCSPPPIVPDAPATGNTSGL